VGAYAKEKILDRCSRNSDYNDPISLDVNSKVTWWLADLGNVAGHSRIFAISPMSTNVKTQCGHCEIPDTPGRWVWRVIDLRWERRRARCKKGLVFLVDVCWWVFLELKVVHRWPHATPGQALDHFGAVAARPPGRRAARPQSHIVMA
jgi:hypothetical protein